MKMASFQQLLELTDQRTKDSVFGFARQSFQNYDIPDLVQYLCLQYYSRCEFFAKYDPDCISNADDIITSKSSANCSVYGAYRFKKDVRSRVILNGEIKIVKCFYNICIGIDSSDGEYISDYFEGKPGSIGYNDNGSVYEDGKVTQAYGCDGYDNGDIMKLSFDTQNGSLLIYKNGALAKIKELKVTDEKEYKLCVSFGAKYECVELVSFQRQCIS